MNGLPDASERHQAILVLKAYRDCRVIDNAANIVANGAVGDLTILTIVMISMLVINSVWALVGHTNSSDSFREEDIN